MLERRQGQLPGAARDSERAQSARGSSAHGVRRILLERQAASLGLPLHQILISKDATSEEYELKMGEAFSAYRGKGIDSVAFGDLFLADIRAYRQRLLAKHDMTGLYPMGKGHVQIDSGIP